MRVMLFASLPIEIFLIPKYPWTSSTFFSDLYSDKKDLTLNKTTNQIIVSWLDSPELEQKYTQYEKINEEKKEVLDQ